MLMNAARRQRSPRDDTYPPSHYRRPTKIHSALLGELLADIGRDKFTGRQLEIFKTNDEGLNGDVPLYMAGKSALLHRFCVSIVGTREASAEGKARAARLAKELVAQGVVV